MPEVFDIEKNLRIYDIWLAGRMFKQRIIQAYNMNSEGLAIDIGCGRGQLTITREETIGIDISPKLNQVNENNKDREFVRCSADYLPFRDNAFNCAFALDVFEHVPDCEKATEESLRVLKRDGNFILSLPNQNLFFKILSKLFRAVYGNPPDLHSYDYVRNVVNGSFEKIETRYAPSTPSFLKLWEISKYKPQI